MVSGQDPGQSPDPMPLDHRSLSGHSSESFLSSFHIYLLITGCEVGSEQLLATPGVTVGEPGDLSVWDGVGGLATYKVNALVQSPCPSPLLPSFRMMQTQKATK